MAREGPKQRFTGPCSRIHRIGVSRNGACQSNVAEVPAVICCTLSPCSNTLWGPWNVYKRLAVTARAARCFSPDCDKPGEYWVPSYMLPTPLVFTPEKIFPKGQRLWALHSYSHLQDNSQCWPPLGPSLWFLDTKHIEPIRDCSLWGNFP